MEYVIAFLCGFVLMSVWLSVYRYNASLKSDIKPQKAHGFNYQLPWWKVARQPHGVLWLEISIAGYDLFAVCIMTNAIQLSLFGFSLAWWHEI